MTPVLRATSAYGDPASSAKSARQIEYQAFAKITKALSRSASRPSAAAVDAENGPISDRVAESRRFAELAAALHENLRLWTIVQTDVAAPQNNLPEDLRARLFYLAEFTREHTQKVLRGDAEADALIEINTAVMRGLRTEKGPEQCQA